MHVEELAAKLSLCKVTDLATGLAMDPQVGEVWKEHPDPGAYVALAEDARRPAPIRFAAALMLRSVSVVQFKKVNPQAMAQVFATALRDDLAGYAFPWGSLWGPGDPVGLLGQVFVELGRPAEPALEALLDDATPRDAYLGRDEVAAMATRRYRVKDFAAFYLAKIAGLELPWEPDLDRRDQAIERLRRQLLDVPPAGSRPARVGGVTSSQLDHGASLLRGGGARVRAAHPECQVARSGAQPDRDASVCRRRSLDHR
jgi:hypothetical protein